MTLRQNQRGMRRQDKKDPDGTDTRTVQTHEKIQAHGGENDKARHGHRNRQKRKMERKAAQVQIREHGKKLDSSGEQQSGAGRGGGGSCESKRSLLLRWE